MEKLKVYISCALTYAPLEYKEQIFTFKDMLRKIPWIEVLDFVMVNSVQEYPDTGHIYCNDIYDCVGKAHVLISGVSIPSIGLGWEMGTFNEKHVGPILMCAHEDAKVTKLVLGAVETHPGLSLKRYKESITDLLDYFLSELKIIHTQLQLKKAL